MVMQDATWSPTDNKVSIQIAYWSAQLDGAVPTELPVDPAAGSGADPDPVGFEVPACDEGVELPDRGEATHRADHRSRGAVRKPGTRRPFKCDCEGVG